MVRLELSNFSDPCFFLWYRLRRSLMRPRVSAVCVKIGSFLSIQGGFLPQGHRLKGVL